MLKMVPIYMTCFAESFKTTAKGNLVMAEWRNISRCGAYHIVDAIHEAPATFANGRHLYVRLNVWDDGGTNLPISDELETETSD